MPQEPQEQLILFPPTGSFVRPVGDGKSVAIGFRFADRPNFGVRFANQDLSLFVERLLSVVAKMGTSQKQKSHPKELMSEPVPVTRIDFVPDPRDETSAVLLVAMGETAISFQMDSTMMVEECMRVAAKTKSLGSRPVQH